MSPAFMLIFAATPLASLADAGMLIVDQPRDWTFVALQCALLAIQIGVLVYAWRKRFGYA